MAAVGLLATTLLTWNSYSQFRLEHENREQPVADVILAALQRKLEGTRSVLRGLAGLEMASESVTLPELQRFVAALGHDESSLDGIGWLGYAKAAAAKVPILLIAPLDSSSRRLLGSDLWSQVRGGSQELQQEPIPAEGWLLPGRSRPGEPPFLVQILAVGSRLEPAAPTRWAFATLPLQDFLRAALNHPLIQLEEPVDLQLYSSDRADPAQLLYDSRNLARTEVLPHAQSRRLETGGQRWLLLVQVPLKTSGPWLPTWGAVLLLGLATSLLAALLTHQLLRRAWQSRQEEQSLGELRSQLGESLQSLRLHRQACSLIQEGLVVTDSNGSILSCNEAYTAITGFAQEELLGRNPRLMNSGYQSKAFFAAMWEELLSSGGWSIWAITTPSPDCPTCRWPSCGWGSGASRPNLWR
ncbi:PAS domain S-box protein [Synechococcus sp. BA-132 BA5]|uniref:PAS domain S-box protein n=1 Tax=Synechococcus sp. BA-132 BA5 TaxID=3110252 RepID=UPI002B21D6F2|nr:PAS domain S-box protein [Synechococcus sp. BA-132 BA5]MEA5415837.1 PAS domain S-box protein [Synechococcus sp. BA-132 BA5]